MTPVAIGDTQGTLQARKTCITPYKRPETLVWVYMYTYFSILSHFYLMSLIKWQKIFCHQKVPILSYTRQYRGINDEFMNDIVRTISKTCKNLDYLPQENVFTSKGLLLIALFPIYSLRTVWLNKEWNSAASRAEETKIQTNIAVT